MLREKLYITSGGEGWTLVHDGKRIGPYSAEKDALSIAQTWAEGARRQGIILEFVVQGGEGSDHPLISPEDHTSGRSDER